MPPLVVARNTHTGHTSVSSDTLAVHLGLAEDCDGEYGGAGSVSLWNEGHTWWNLRAFLRRLDGERNGSTQAHHNGEVSALHLGSALGDSP